jgi:hypothetical protein
VFGAYWALHFEELVLWTHKGFMGPHSTSTLDTSCGKLNASAPARKKSDAPAGGIRGKIWNIHVHARRMRNQERIIAESRSQLSLWKHYKSFIYVMGGV